MDSLQIIAPLIGVVLGAALAGIAAQLRARKERKRIIALALSDLLEVRHRMIAVELVLKKVSSIVQIKRESLPSLRNMIDSLLPLDSGLDERYNAAISLLAGIDPVLAFNLRSRNAPPKMLATLHAIATSGVTDLASFESFEAMLRSAATPHLNRAVEQLALSHSFLTAYKVRKLVKQSEGLSPEVNQFFEQLKQSLASSPSDEPTKD